MNEIYTPKHKNDYFDRNTLLPQTLADDIRQDLLIGPDGCYYVYQDGVFVRDEFIIQKRVNEILGNSASPTHTSRVKHIIDPLLEPLTYDSPSSNYINVLNGMYNYKEQRLEPHAIHFKSFIQLPIFYNPEAQCPNFDKFLSMIIDEDLIDMIWEVIGYLLMPGNPLQKAILLYGYGSNGKSTLINVIEKMIGRKNISNITLKQLSRVFEPAELFGKQMNSVGDLDIRYLEDTDNFKKITGGDPIVAQRKGRDPFTFTNWATPIFAANSLWKSPDLSEGYFRRWHIIPFDNKLKIPNFTTFFANMTTDDELSGIFNKAMIHLPNLLTRNSFQSNMYTSMLFEDFKRSSDNVALWLDDDDTITVTRDYDPDDKTVFTPRTKAYEIYRNWCFRSGHRPSTNQAFYERLRNLHFSLDKKKNNTFVIFGLKVKTITDASLIN